MGNVAGIIVVITGGYSMETNQCYGTTTPPPYPCRIKTVCTASSTADPHHLHATADIGLTQNQAYTTSIATPSILVNPHTNFWLIGKLQNVELALDLAKLTIDGGHAVCCVCTNTLSGYWGVWVELRGYWGATRTSGYWSVGGATRM
jgi:hypothetical protein